MAPRSLIFVILASTLAGCGFGQGVQDGISNGLQPTPTAQSDAPQGLTASQVADELNKLNPTPHPRDNTGSCAARADSTSPGCVQLITTDAVSVYQWTDESQATRFCEPGVSRCDRIGVFVLSYAGTEQKATSKKARAAYADKVRQLANSSK